MKRGRLPLTALRSFEVAGRLLSFTAAASELHVSQAAISRQVRELEALIGASLFARHHRSVTLTAEGRDLLSVLTDSFDRIDMTLSGLVAAQQTGNVRVSCEPSFAAVWLVPRLSGFRQRHPGIAVDLDTDQRLADFRASGVDLAIRFSSSKQQWPRSESEPLHREVVSVFISPLGLAKGPPLEKPADLLGHTLLFEDRTTPWAAWFAAAGLPDIRVPDGPVLSDGGLTMQAALRGHGVMLGSPLALADELAAGMLVQPFDITIAYGRYFLVARSFATLTPAARHFADWLTDEIDRSALARG